MEQFTPAEVERMHAHLGELLRTGDILYRSSEVYGHGGLPFSTLVADATDSVFTHAALASRTGEIIRILEINETGTHFPTLFEWLSGRYGRDMCVFRHVEDSILGNTTRTEAFRDFISGVVLSHPGYDFSFSNHGKFYCTEMVVEAYRRCANVNLQRPETLYEIIKHPTMWTPVIKTANFALMKAGSQCYLPEHVPLYYPGNANRGMMSSRWTECIFTAKEWLQCVS